MSQNAYQQSFFDYLYNFGNYHRTDKFADDVAAALHVSRSGAYKKIKCISKLTFDESMRVCAHFGVSLQRFLDTQGLERSSYAFQSDDIVNKVSSYGQWANNILQHSYSLDKLRDDYKIYTFGDEVPVFHYLPFHHLLSFKLFVWNRSIWNIPQYGEKYDFIHFDRDSELKSTIAEINDHYLSYESIDIWSTDFLNDTLSQLRYYAKMGVFAKREAPILILADIKKLINHLRNTAKSGCKMRFGSKEKHAAIDIYLNFTHTNPELIYIQSASNRMVYSSYLSPNYLRTTDPRICDYTSKWIDKAIEQSYLISKVGEIERESAFSNGMKALEGFEETLKYYMK